MRGEILRYDDATGAGLISGDDGQRYSFQRADLQQLQPVSPGDRVDFVPDPSGAARDVVLLAPVGPRKAYTGEDLSLWGYFRKCLSKYADGQGRARRKEYWSFQLFSGLLGLVPCLFGVLLVMAGYEDTREPTPLNVVGWLLVMYGFFVGLALIIPSIAVTIRRFHDVGMSGWLYLLVLVPYVGGLFVFVVSLLPSQDKENAHGPVPKPRTT